MKTPLLLAFVVSVCARLTAAPLTPDSRITAVTVYADRAVVTRTAQLAFPGEGVIEAVFDRLPATLLEESLQVSGRGATAATLLDVGARTAFVDFTPNERVKALEDELRQVNRQDRTLTDRMNVLNQQREYVLKIQIATTSPAEKSGDVVVLPETWAKLLSFSEERLGAIAAELQTIDQNREDLQARRSALEKQLGELRGQRGRNYKVVTVRLAAAAAGSFELTLRYTVPGAAWRPSYDARVHAGDRLVQLGYFGLVRQNTGEDWNNVALTLSTARPSLGGAAPELSPWIVQQQEVRPLARAQEARERVALAPFAAKVSSAGGAAADNYISANLPEAQVQTQATSATFALATPATVPSDNAEQKQPIAQLRLAAAPRYATTPKLQPSAFLTAEVANASDYPLLAGLMNVFLNETFVATSHLRTVMPAEKFELALGVDDGIAIKRTLNNRFVEDTGLVTKSKRITYDSTITVQNHKRTAETIVVTDQIPVSRHEKIVVRQLAPDERQLKPDSAGLLKWTLELKPGEKRELPVKFSVEHPVDLPVTGLE